MTTLPDSRRADARVSDLYRRNVSRLGPDDIVVASHGGSGQSLIGNILAELRLNYVDAYTEELHRDGRAVVAAAHTPYRRHLASQHDKDVGGAEPVRRWPRFVKTHHPPAVFGDAPVGGVWILVRDPRDAIYASHQWRVGFAEEEWDRVPASFPDWLRGPGDFSPSPVDDWPAFYTAWARRADSCAHVDVLRFEDLKTRPVEVVATALGRLGVAVDRDAVAAAVEASSFDRMRAHEDRVAAGDGDPATATRRVVREGRTQGWKRWMTPELATLFTGPDLRLVAAEYGYQLPGAP
ncbi:sulfotransferase domain-containing protein [Micromonospora cathayae]|uniref:Sulfotransferase domain-containing protein n=1 Tax=Micromonospora cathayae TaxID=3028804 RepID=A0ABY7ZS62_9ACTN|nr:sulfotransferase domain-containing protein [Micromonospora sp. HUAS 3]WDZ84794.1 sulfotransferase domain-containing protein [Micromonospora sp. HUAS 3]